MNPLGIVTGVFGDTPTEGVLDAAAAAGFTTVQLDYWKATAAPTPEDAAAVRRACEARGLTVAALSAYTNLVDADDARRRLGLDRLLGYIRVAPEFGAPVVATESGSLSAVSAWTDHPDNHTPRGRARLRAALAVVLPACREAGVALALEPFVHNVVDSAAAAERLFAEFPGAPLGVVMDPVNLLHPADLQRQGAAFDDAFRRLGDRILVAHAKDVVRTNDHLDHPGPGLGVLDFPAYLALLARHAPAVPLIIEHLTTEQVPAARAYVLSQYAHLTAEAGT